MARFRLTYTVDLIGDHEVANEAAAIEKSRELHGAFRASMTRLGRPGVLLPVASVSPHPIPDPEQSHG